jgi:hypothetical protein
MREAVGQIGGPEAKENGAELATHIVFRAPSTLEGVDASSG